MLDWLDDILRGYNRRNADYYKKVFETMNQTNQTTFNYGACFFPTVWFVYRKMYMWLIVYVILREILNIVLGLCLPWCEQEGLIPYILYTLTLVFCGRFGNSLYYKTVKSRVIHGYHLIDAYNPISIMGVAILLLTFVAEEVFSIVLTDPIEIIILCRLFEVLVVMIMWFSDYLIVKGKLSYQSSQVNQYAINNYIDKANPKDMIIMFLSILLYLVFCLDETSRTIGRKSDLSMSQNIINNYD